jgi:hypothetical protein
MSTTMKPVYGASSALTTTNLQSLATSSGLTTGWSSAVIDNTSNLSIDEEITGILKQGTSPTVGTTAEVWVWSILDDTPTYPDAITGSEASGIALTSTNVKYAGAFKFGCLITFDATSSRLYPFSFNLSQVFGLILPKKWGLFITQASGVSLASSGNVVSRIPMQLQSV